MKAQKKPAHLIHAVITVIFGCLTGLLCTSWLQGHTTKPAIIKSLSGQFTDRFTNSCLFLLQPNKHDIRSNFIAIYQKQGDGFVKKWHSPAAPIWDINLGDVDGDGTNEVALCLYKKEVHDPKQANRLQIYAWGKNGLYAKWRGTFLCHPFYRIYLMDLDNDGKTELISIEKYMNQNLLCIYHWNGFGFDLAAKTALPASAERLYRAKKPGDLSPLNLQAEIYTAAKKLMAKGY